MSLELNNLIKEPEYFHREYQNDLPKENTGVSYLDQSKRFALVALPFLSLYKPFSYPLSLAFGGIRTVVSLTQLFAEGEKGLTKDSLIAFFQSTVAITAFAGTIFAHPLGMLITTVNDVATESIHVGQNIYQGEYKAAMSGSIQIVNNALYLALFAHGGIELLIASLAMQTLIGLGNSVSEYQEGNYLEAGGHFLMAMIRGNQMVGQIQLLQYQKKMEEIILRNKNENKAGTGIIFPEDYSTYDFRNGTPINIQLENGESVFILPAEFDDFFGMSKMNNCVDFQIFDYNRNGEVIGNIGFFEPSNERFQHILWRWSFEDGVSILFDGADLINMCPDLPDFDDLSDIINIAFAWIDDLGDVFGIFQYSQRWTYDFYLALGVFKWSKSNYLEYADIKEKLYL